MCVKRHDPSSLDLDDRQEHVGRGRVAQRRRGLGDLESRDYSSHGCTKDFRYARLRINVGGNPSRRWIVAIKQRRLNVSTTRISRAAQQETRDAGKTAKPRGTETQTEVENKN